MPEENVFTAHNRLLDAVAPQLRTPGQEFDLRGVTVPHYPVKDTAFAACLATLGVPFREPAPYTDDVAIDEKGNETGRTTVWWLGDVSTSGGATAHKTEEMIGAWWERERFEREHPLHPLNAMRAALDARAWWIAAIHSFFDGRALLPIEAKDAFATDKLHAASILKACGFKPLAFNRPSFFLQRTASGLPAQQMLLQAALQEGATPPQWMSRVLFNYSHLVKIAKQQSVILRQTIGDQTLLLTADATAKTREKFHKLL